MTPGNLAGGGNAELAEAQAPLSPGEQSRRPPVLHFRDPCQLTPREITVLTLIADGATTKQAAEALHLKPHSIDLYVCNIREKLGARSRTQAVATAVRLGII